MKEFEAVVFDMDGVIFDSEKLVVLCWQEIADKYGIKDIAEACHECLGLNRVATKETISKVKRQPSEWEKIIANEATDK